MPDDPAAAGAEGGAERDLLLPNGSAGEEQVGDVGAGDQQHAADGAEENVEAARDVADQVFAQRRGAGTEFRVRVRILAGERGGDRPQFGVGLRDRGAGFQPADPLQAVTAALFGFRFASVRAARVDRDGDKDLGRIVVDRERKVGRHDADNGERPTVERD